MTYLLRYFCLALLLAVSALRSTPATAEKRVALVIGNSAYQHTTLLTNPRNDAEDIIAALRRLEFEVVPGGIDLDKRAMERVIREFTGKLGGVDVALFFFAGHAVQVSGQNFLVPVDAQLGAETDIDFETVPLSLVLRHMQREAATSLVFLDACRDNPLIKKIVQRSPTRSSVFGQGLAPVETGAGAFISFSTQPGHLALDGDGRNSPYAGALLRYMEGDNTAISAVMIRVRNQVMATTRSGQVPWEHSSLRHDFSFRRVATAAAAPPPAAPPPPQGNEAMHAWSATKDTTSAAVLEAFLNRHPTGIYADMARARLNELKLRSAAVAPAAAAPPAGGAPATPLGASRSEMFARITAWVAKDYVEDRTSYAETVDWYDKGPTSREAIVKERNAYMARWPERKYTLVPGSLQITTSGPNRYVATFDISYRVRSEARKVERAGHSRIMIDLEARDGQFIIARQKEIVGR
jgi:hypothetical protein